MIPQKISINDVIDIIISLAQEVGVKTVPLETQPWMKQHIGENTYYTLRISVEVEGLFSQVQEYISRLESGAFSTLVVERLIVQIVDEEAYAGGSTPVEASLDLTVFAQP